MINKVTLIGRIGKDPELKRTPTGVFVCKFSVATTESYKDKAGEWQNETSWHEVVAWGPLAERCEKLSKGASIYAEGRLSYRSYETKEGQKRTATEIIASTVRLLDKREQAEPKESHVKTGDSFPFDDDLAF